MAAKDGPMHDPIIILGAPRSFTSVVCAMLGRHPQTYGLPEVNLFVAETMREREGLLSGWKFANNGLLRTVAQLFAEQQTVQTVFLARRWTAIRRASTCVSVFQELGKRVSPRILVDKSPKTALCSENLQRVRRSFPKARFIHLVRHPRSQGESLWKLGGSLWGLGGTVVGERLQALDYSTDPPTIDFQKTWYTLNNNTVTFLDGLSKDQQIRIRGEDLLTDVDLYLRQIAEWLGLPTDEQAIEAMKHPERSPYAFLGPVNAPFGNDPNFLKAPALRSNSRPKKQTLDGPLSWCRDGRGFSTEVKALAREFGYK